MSVFSRLIPDNPVLTKELRVRMRGSRAYWILLGYLGFIAVLVLVRYNSFQSAVTSIGAGGSASSSIGTELFNWIMIPQVFLVLFITPAITSGSLTIEREQQTMDLLTLTRLSRRGIVLGKLMSAVSFTALLIISSLPLISICFMLGGVDPLQVFSAYMMMLAASVLIGSMGIMWSSAARTTTQAVMLTYFTLFLLFLFVYGSFMQGLTQKFAPTGLPSASETAFNALSQSWFGNQFIGFRVPEGFGFAVFSLLCGTLMTSVATARIEMFPDRKAGTLRALTLLLISLQAFSVANWWVSAWYHRGSRVVMTAVQPPIGAMIIPCIALLLLVPIFATGEVASFEAQRIGKYLRWSFSPAGFKRGKLGSGIPFLAVATLVTVCAYWLAFVPVGKAGAAFHSGALSLGLPGLPPPAPININGQPGETVTVTGQTMSISRTNGSAVTATKLPNGGIQVNRTDPNGMATVSILTNWPVDMPVMPPPPPASTLVAPQTGDMLQATVALLATIVGFGLFCVLCSVAFRSRWVSAVAGYVLLAILWIVPDVSTSYTTSMKDTSIWANLGYLNPIQVFSQICEPANYWQNRFLMFGHTPMWQVCTLAWGALSVLFLALILIFVRIIAKENAPIPYEELVQLA